MPPGLPLRHLHRGVGAPVMRAKLKPAAEAFDEARCLVRAQVRVVDARAQAWAERPADRAALHDTRTALRRLRVFVRSFRNELGALARRAVRRRLRKAFRACSSLRDPDASPPGSSHCPVLRRHGTSCRRPPPRGRHRVTLRRRCARPGTARAVACGRNGSALPLAAGAVADSARRRHVPSVWRSVP